jgi:hypothetical protein
MGVKILYRLVSIPISIKRFLNVSFSKLDNAYRHCRNRFSLPLGINLYQNLF